MAEGAEPATSGEAVACEAEHVTSGAGAVAEGAEPTTTGGAVIGVAKDVTVELYCSCYGTYIAAMYLVFVSRKLYVHQDTPDFLIL